MQEMINPVELSRQETREICQYCEGNEVWHHTFFSNCLVANVVGRPQVFGSTGGEA